MEPAAQGEKILSANKRFLLIKLIYIFPSSWTCERAILKSNHVVKNQDYDWLILETGAVSTCLIFAVSFESPPTFYPRFFVFIVIRMQRSTRMKRELDSLTTEPPPGISCWPVDDQIDKLQAGKI